MTMIQRTLVLACLCQSTVAFTAPAPQPIIASKSRKAFQSSTSRLGLSPRTPLDGEMLSSISIQKTSLPVSNVANPGEDGGNQFWYNDETDVHFDQKTTKVFHQKANSTILCNSQNCAQGNPEESAAALEGSFLDGILNSYIGPRLLLAAVACLYGTNFPLGAIMDSALPASAATSSRMVIAAVALSPFLFKLHKDLIGMALLAGCFTATGYVAQSLALVDTSPATVSFLGAATVIWCPFLEWLVDKKPMSWKDRPQTWLAGLLCLMGVGILELGGNGGVQEAVSHIGMGDGLAVLQAMGFGTGVFLSEKMMKKQSGQALPVTAALVAVTAFISMLWSFADGWIGTAPGWESMTLPNMFFDTSMHEVAMAVLWTGLLSTSLNFFLEVFCLGLVPTGEASVILASEPLWAAAFAAVILGESFGWNDYAGGFLIVAACLVNSVKTGDIQNFLGGAKESPQEE